MKDFFIVFSVVLGVFLFTAKTMTSQDVQKGRLQASKILVKPFQGE